MRTHHISCTNTCRTMHGVNGHGTAAMLAAAGTGAGAGTSTGTSTGTGMYSTDVDFHILVDESNVGKAVRVAGILPAAVQGRLLALGSTSATCLTKVAAGSSSHSSSARWLTWKAHGYSVLVEHSAGAGSEQFVDEALHSAAHRVFCDHVSVQYGATHPTALGTRRETVSHKQIINQNGMQSIYGFHTPKAVAYHEPTVM